MKKVSIPRELVWGKVALISNRRNYAQPTARWIRAVDRDVYVSAGMRRAILTGYKPSLRLRLCLREREDATALS